VVSVIQEDLPVSEMHNVTSSVMLLIVSLIPSCV